MEAFLNFINRLFYAHGRNIPIIIILFLLIAYFSPPSERMICDRNYKCTIEHTVVFNIKRKDTFYLLPASQISFQPKYYRRRNSSRIADYINLPIFNIKRRKDLNIFYVNQYNHRYRPFESSYLALYPEDSKEDKINLETERFEQYMVNPAEGYEIKPTVNHRGMFFDVVIILIACIVYYVRREL